MITGKQPKSILKKKTYPEIKFDANHNRDIALQHAFIIQQRKKIELEILFSTETLIDYPRTSSTADASNPSPVDIYNFKNLIRSFQPSDYDSLIVERNIDDRCGYALCPNRRNKEESQGKYRLLGTNGKAKDFKVIEKAELEKWCSDTCALRAMYVRVQLSEIPAWERVTAETGTIDLLVGPTAKEVHVHNPKTDSDNYSKSHYVDNTVFGKEFTNHNPEIQSVLINIQEKELLGLAQPPLLDGNETSYLNIEGYTTSNINPNQNFGQDRDAA